MLVCSLEATFLVFLPPLFLPSLFLPQAEEKALRAFASAPKSS